MIKSSTFTIKNVGEFEVNIESPDNLVEAIGLERANSLLRQFGHAHWVQSGIKAAFERDAAKRDQADKDLIEAVKNGSTIYLMDFVPNSRGDGLTKADLDFAEQGWVAYSNGSLTEAALTKRYAEFGLTFVPTDNKATFIKQHAERKRAERLAAKKSLA